MIFYDGLIKNISKIFFEETKINQIPVSFKEFKSINLIDLRYNPVQELTSYFNSTEWSSKIKIV